MCFVERNDKMEWPICTTAMVVPSLCGALEVGFNYDIMGDILPTTKMYHYRFVFAYCIDNGNYSVVLCLCVCVCVPLPIFNIYFSGMGGYKVMSIVIKEDVQDFTKLNLVCGFKLFT